MGKINNGKPIKYGLMNEDFNEEGTGE